MSPYAQMFDHPEFDLVARQLLAKTTVSKQDVNKMFIMGGYQRFFLE